MEKTDVNKKIEEVIFKTFSNSSFLNAYLIETNNNNQDFIVEQITKLLLDNKINNDDLEKASGEFCDVIKKYTDA